MPRLPGTTGCKTFWVSSTRLCLRHIGDVTVVLRKRGRNVGPKQTKILVTHLDEGILRQVVSAYQRRWPVEQINRELNPTATLECIAKICPCKMAVLQGPVISVMSVGSAHNSLCYRVCSYKCRCRVMSECLAVYGVW